MIRFLLRILSPKDAAVLDAAAAIGESALRRWIERGFITESLARAELARRGLKP